MADSCAGCGGTWPSPGYRRTFPVLSTGVTCILLLISILAVLVTPGQGANILGCALPHPTHFGASARILEALAARGHNVTLLTSEHYNEKLIASYNKSVHMVFHGGPDILTVQRQNAQDEGKTAGVIESLSKIGSLLDTILVAQGQVASTLLLNSTADDGRKKVDIFVTDMFCPYAIITARERNIPIVAVQPLGLTFMGGSVHDGFRRPHYMPCSQTGMPLARTLPERVFHTLFCDVIMPYVLPNIVPVRRHLSDGSRFRYREIYGTAYGLEPPVPYPPRVSLVGPLFDLPPPAKLSSRIDPDIVLSDSLRSWVMSQDAQQGIVYLSMGTTVAPTRVMMDGFIDTMKSLPHIRFLWALPALHHHLVAGGLERLPRNVRVETWVPAVALYLTHHVLVSITQCGVASAYEPIYYTALPVICVPVQYDQPDIARRLLDTGSSLTVLPAMIAEGRSDLREAIMEITPNNSSYRVRARYVQKLMLAPGGVARAVQIVEEELHLGSTHLLLDPMVYEASWFVWSGLDVLCTIVLVLLAMGMAIHKLWRCCCCRRKDKQKKE